MKIVITIVMCISWYLSGSFCQAIVAIESAGSSSSASPSSIAVSTEVLTIVAVEGRVIRTTEGNLPMARDFRALVRKNGRVIEQQDLSRLAGRRGTGHLVNGKVAWILIEAKEEKK